MFEYGSALFKRQLTLIFMLQSQLEPALVTIRKAQPDSTNSSWDALDEFEKKIDAKQTNKKQ